MESNTDTLKLDIAGVTSKTYKRQVKTVSIAVVYKIPNTETLEKIYLNTNGNLSIEYSLDTTSIINSGDILVYDGLGYYIHKGNILIPLNPELEAICLERSSVSDIQEVGLSILRELVKNNQPRIQ